MIVQVLVQVWLSLACALQARVFVDEEAMGARTVSLPNLQMPRQALFQGLNQNQGLSASMRPEAGSLRGLNLTSLTQTLGQVCSHTRVSQNPWVLSH